MALQNQRLDESLYKQVHTLLTEPGSILQAMGDGAIITALGASVIAACTTEKLCGEDAHANLGNSIFTHIVSVGAAIGAFPLNLFTVSFAPIGALVSAFFGAKEKRKVHHEADEKSRAAWSYFRFVYELILEDQQQFLDSSVHVRKASLRALLESLDCHAGLRTTNLSAQDFIQYTQTEEERLRSQIITRILNTEAFVNKDERALTRDELELFMGELTKNRAPNFSKNQKKESALLTIRFVYHLLRTENLHGQTADIIKKMVKGGE